MQGVNLRTIERCFLIIGIQGAVKGIIFVCLAPKVCLCVFDDDEMEWFNLNKDL